LIALFVLAAIRVWSEGPTSTSSIEEKESLQLPEHAKNPRGRVFCCGYKVPLAEYLFPDYEYVGEARNLSEIPDFFENDIMVDGLWGPCDEYGNLRETFPGKILYVNAEPIGNPVDRFWKERHQEHRKNVTDDKVYQIGPYPPWNNETSDSEFGKFFHAHSLQVYHTVGQFMGFIYLPTRRHGDHHLSKSDIDHKDNVNDASDGIQPRRKTDDNKPYRVFDPWKQLVEGNGRSSISAPEPARIPAVVYVSRNCVPYRQEAAKLLAQEFRDLAVSGVEQKSKKNSLENTRRKLGETSNGTKEEDSRNATTDFQALHQRAAEFNEARKNNKRSNANNNNNEPHSILQRAIEDNLHYHERNLPVVIVDRDGNELRDDNGNWEASFVHYGGSCKVKGGIAVPPLEGWQNKDRNTFRSNYETIYTRYKYCLVMENTKKDGYVTEKLMHALLGGCLPIYYGSKDVYKIFRNDSFVYMDIDNPRPALDEIRRLENDPSEYLRRTDRKLPLLKAASVEDPYDTAATVDSYFSVFPGIGTGKLCKEIHEMMGLDIPESLIPAKEPPPSSFFPSWWKRE